MSKEHKVMKFYIYHLHPSKQIEVSSNPMKSVAEKGYEPYDYEVLQITHNSYSAEMLANDWRDRFKYPLKPLRESKFSEDRRNLIGSAKREWWKKKKEEEKV